MNLEKIGQTKNGGLRNLGIECEQNKNETGET
jgi:hypothetical protein